MNTIPKMLCLANGRESMVEVIVQACAIRGGFDNFLGTETTLSRTVYRGRRGHADVEVLNAAGHASVGIEVKLVSQVNWGHYGNGPFRSQFDEMIKHVETLVIITTVKRAKRGVWPDNAVVLTLDDLALIAAEVDLTAEDIVAVGLGHAA